PRSGSRPRAGFLAARRTLGRAWCGAGGLRLERCNARLQDLILVTRGGSHGLYGFELVAADEILAPNPLAEFLASARLCLAAHARHGPGKAVHHLHEVVEHLVLGLHCTISLSAAI